MQKKKKAKAATKRKSKKHSNSLAQALNLRPGIGGGFSPFGYPGTLGSPYTEQVEKSDTVFKNLRWYLVTNMWQMLSQAYVEIGLVQTIINVPVDDALRGGIHIKSDQLSEDEIAELKVAIDRDNDMKIIGDAAKWDRLYGGAGVIVLTDQDPATPLDLDAISEDEKIEFRAADIWELMYDGQSAQGYSPTIQTETFEYYTYYGTRIHKSRVMRMEGILAPAYLRPRLRGWGLSCVEMLVRSINQYLKGTDLIFEVLDEFKVDIYKIKGLTQTLLSPNGTEKIQNRVALANMEKNYNNALTMDAEDDWQARQISFSGIPESMLQIRMQVAADMRMPMSKLFGISATGFASGEDDIEVYNAMVESQVRNKIKYVILRMLEIKCQQMFGYVPDDLSITFEPLRVMSSEQQENVKTQKMNRTIQALQAGGIDMDEFRDNINKGELLDITLAKNVSLIDRYEANMDAATMDGQDGEDTDNPGEARSSSSKPTADSKGGAPKGETKPKSGEQKAASKEKEGSAKPTKNELIPFSRVQRILRKLRNSPEFDRASYEADGGDSWIDPRRAEFYKRPDNVDGALWMKARQASVDAYGCERWQFIAWWYEKHGGKYSRVTRKG